MTCKDHEQTHFRVRRLDHVTDVETGERVAVDSFTVDYFCATHAPPDAELFETRTSHRYSFNERMFFEGLGWGATFVGKVGTFEGMIKVAKAVAGDTDSLFWYYDYVMQIEGEFVIENGQLLL